MASCTNGKFRMVTCDNLAKVCQAWFNNKMSAQDLALMCHPDNKIELTLTMLEEGKKIRIEPSYSMKPEFNMSVEYTLGEEQKFGEPYNCTVKVTMDGCVMKEECTHLDGNTFTYTNTFSSQGITMRCESGKGEYIATAYMELVDTSLEGFYIMDHHEGLDTMMMEDVPSITPAMAAELCSHLALRITIKDGVYTMTDYLGNGTTKVESYSLDKEFEVNHPEYNIKGTAIATRPEPGKFIYRMTHADSGKVQEWSATLCDLGLMFSTDKPLHKTAAKIFYRRYPDLIGSWKTVNQSNTGAAMKVYGMPQSMIDEMVAEKSTLKLEYLGKGLFQYTSDSKVFPMEAPVTWRSGEETTITASGMTFTEVYNLTKTGMVGAIYAQGKTTTFTTTVGRTFMVYETEMEGHPETKAVTIMARV